MLIRQSLRALARNLPSALREDVSALHQARVASRRLREALPVVASGSRIRKLERQVRRITRALGPVRELDVALHMLDELERSGDVSKPALQQLRESVTRERQRLQADMQNRLERCDLQKLRKRALAAARTAGAEGRTRDPRQLALARQRAVKRAERLRTAIDNAAGIYLPDRLHDVRIAVKKLRYSLELVRQLSGSRANRTIRTLKAAQDLLGRMHDLEVLIARTRAIQGSPNPPSLKVSAELDRIIRRLETEARQRHGHYTASRDALLGICEQTIAVPSAKPQASAA